MSYAVGSQQPHTGYSDVPPAVLSGASSGSYRNEAPAALDVDGAVCVPVVHTGGLFTTAIVGATGANVKTTQGRVARALVTATGTAALLIYDNALGNGSGTVIGVIPANAAVGSIYAFDMPAANGISVPGVASSPNITLAWS